MTLELKIPNVGESIVEVQIGQWLAKEGSRVEKDQPIVELESDKATVELPSPVAGVIAKVLKQPGDKAAIDETIALIAEGEDEGATGRAGDGAREEATPGRRAPGTPGEERRGDGATGRCGEEELHPFSRDTEPGTGAGERVGGRPESALAPVPEQGEEASRPPTPRGEEELVPMSAIRKRIAERLVAAQHEAALLTTFNEIDVSALQGLRKEYQAPFQQRFGVKLGLMSFFVKATIEALKQVPQLNAEIRGDNIVYRNYFDIGIAVSGGKGLVVPVLRNAERLSFAEIEQAINDLAERAKGNKIALDELAGGTFTITNGGVFGSLLSTPIVNPPQSGILGLHAIQDRPVAREGQVVIRPMMYVALTYDHRIVDGREAVLFLGHVKDVIENPARMLMEV